MMVPQTGKLLVQIPGWDGWYPANDMHSLRDVVAKVDETVAALKILRDDFTLDDFYPPGK